MFELNENVCEANLSVSDFSDLFCQTNITRNTFFLYMNVRSLNKNINKIDEFLETLPHTPEVIIISKTKLKI